MSTELEKYLIEKRANLDVDVPDDKVIWDKIEERMAKDSGERCTDIRMAKDSRGESPEIRKGLNSRGKSPVIRMGKDNRGKSPDIRKGIHKGISFSSIRKIAATVIILLGVAYIADDIVSDRKAYNNLSLGIIDPSYGERETEYILNIEARIREVSLAETDGNPVIKELVKELQEQDKAYREAISDLRVMGSNERVVNTIFSIYERKIRLLEMIIMETNKQERYEQKNESPV
jgi:hypothetical protein